MVQSDRFSQIQTKFSTSFLKKIIKIYKEKFKGNLKKIKTIYKEIFKRIEKFLKRDLLIYNRNLQAKIISKKKAFNRKKLSQKVINEVYRRFIWKFGVI